MSQITKAKKVYRFRAIPDGGSSRLPCAGQKLNLELTGG